MITIKKLFVLTEDGVTPIWHVSYHGHTTESGTRECIDQDWHTRTWEEALNLAAQVIAHYSGKFLQLSVSGWSSGWVDASRIAYRALSWTCHTCTEAHGEVRRTDNPAGHLSWHRKRLATGLEEQYRADMEELRERRDDDLNRSEEMTAWDYEQRIEKLAKEKAELEGQMIALRMNQRKVGM